MRTKRKTQTYTNQDYLESKTMKNQISRPIVRGKDWCRLANLSSRLTLYNIYNLNSMEQSPFSEADSRSASQ
jgi:hypothetical protein